jgi:SAM-dependent methyltransferase
MTAEKLQREREFHNQVFGHNRHGREAVSSLYSGSISHAYYRTRIHELRRGARVLEYGCGPGSMAFDLARQGSIVTGIDISNVAIELAKAEAQKQGLENLDFLEMNAEEATFEDDRFDLICGTGILHHLDLEKAYAVLARTLHADGNAIFVEPLGHNPVINLYRKLTPHLRTPDEHPLRMKDLKLAEKYFGQVRLRFFQIQTLLAVPFRNFPFIRPLRQTLDTMDQALFRIFPPVRRYAWQVVIEFAKPRKSARHPGSSSI